MDNLKVFEIRDARDSAIALVSALSNAADRVNDTKLLDHHLTDAKNKINDVLKSLEATS